VLVGVQMNDAVVVSMNVYVNAVPPQPHEYTKAQQGKHYPNRAIEVLALRQGHAKTKRERTSN